MTPKIRPTDSAGSFYKSAKAIVVDVNSEGSLNNWSSALGITRKELLQVIREVGPNVKDIRRELKKMSEAS